MPEFENNLAIVIGINNYQNGIPSLQNAVNDATDIKKILEEKHKYKQVWQFSDEKATLKILNNFLENVLPQQVKPNDRLLFYFAGHGTIDKEGNDGPTGYLIPQDAKRGDLKSYLPMAQLYESLNKLPCRHFLGILDCCYAGAFRWLTTRDLLKAPEKIYRQRYDRYIEDPAWQIIASAAYDQKALDSDPFAFERGQIGNNSVFAAALLEALQGQAKDDPFKEGVITATKLYSYLRDRIEPETEVLGKRKRQTPTLIQLKRHDNGEYIFLTPGHRLNLEDAPPLNEKNNPYKGLQSFEEEDSQLFFGRQALTEELYDRICKQALTIVLGASGSGKSSLVKAGLIPHIKQKNPNWHILAPIRPGELPFSALRNAFAKDDFPVATVTTLKSEQKIESLLASLDEWFKLPKNSNLLIVIDQAEELITLCQDEQEREAFLRLLARALDNYPQKLRIVFTLRSDFETQVRSRSLETYWQATGARFFVEDMTREELRSCIEEPASKAVIFFEPHNLVEKLIDEVYRMPGALPLLSFTLSELYLKYLRSVREQGRDNRAITQKDYQELGGILESITKRADEEYNKLVKDDKAYELTIRNVMLRMVAVGDGELARRRVPETELLYPEPEKSRVQIVINQFVDARLLVKDKNDEGKSYVEPAHEALISRWEKILAWKKGKQENLILQRRLTPAAEEWKSQQQARFLWNANPRLDLLKKVSLSEDNWFNNVETEFVERSVRKKRQNSIIRWIIAGSVLLGAMIFSAAVWGQWRNSQLKLANSLGQNSLSLFNNEGKELDAFVEAIKAGKILQTHKQSDPDVIRAFQKVVYERSEHNRLEGHDSYVNSVSFSPDGQTLASGSRDKTIKLWDVKTGKEITPKPMQHELHNENIYSVSFSPDGQTLASGSVDNIIKLWDVKTGKEITPKPMRHDGWVYSVSFSPDGQTLASGSNDKTIKLWDVKTGKEITPKPMRHDGSVYSVSFSPDGQTLASGSTDKTIKLWDVKTGKEIKPLKGHDHWVNSVSFSSDGQTLASGSEDNTVKIWDVKTGKEITPKPMRHDGSVYSVSFSSDGQTLASGSTDKTIKLWDVKTGKEIKPLKGHDHWVYSVSFSPDGQTLASGSGDSTIKLWYLEAGEEIYTLKGYGDKVYSVSFSSDGQTLASGSEDNTIKIWDVKTGKEITPKPMRHDGSVYSVSFSPDGQTLASGSEDNTIKIWDVKTGKEITPKLMRHDGSVYSVSFSSDGQTLASGSNDKTIKIWDVKTGKEITPKPMRHDDFVNSVSFSRNGQILASGSSDNTIKIWDVKTGEEISPKSIQGNSGRVYSVSFSYDGQTLASGGEDNTIKIWDVKTRKEIRTLKGHDDFVNSVSFSPNGQTLASVSNDNTIKLWNLDLNLDSLIERSCDWVRVYLANPSSDLSESDRQLCDGISEPEKHGEISISEPEKHEKISIGDKILVPTLMNPDKLAGVEAISNGDFEGAIKHLEAYLKNTPNDPEALIYLNNARIGNQKSYTIAISAPIGSDVNGALEMLRGVAQAQDEINQQRGINGVPLRVLIADDDDKPDTAKQIAEQLVKNPDVLGVIGHYASDVTLAAGKVYEAGKLVAISPVSTSVKLTNFGNYIFRTVPSDSIAAKALADYILLRLEKKNAAVFYNSQSGYSESLKSEFMKFLRKEGGQVSKFDLSDPNFNADESVKQSIESGAEVLVLLPNTGELNDTLQVLKANKKRLPLLGGDDVYAPKVLKEGAKNSVGMVVAVPWHILAKASQTNFPDTSRQLWKADVNWRTAMSYDATMALIEGLKNNPTREGLAQTLHSQNFTAKSAATGEVKFKSGDRDREIQLVEIQANPKSRSKYGYDFQPVPNKPDK